MLQTHYKLKIRTGIQTLEKLFTTDSSYQYNILRKEQIFLPDVFSHVVVRYIKMKNVKPTNCYSEDTSYIAESTTINRQHTYLDKWNHYYDISNPNFDILKAKS